MKTYEKLELGNELLHNVAVQLKKWSHDPETSGRQHQPMENLAIKIFNHLKVCQPDVTRKRKPTTTELWEWAAKVFASQQGDTE